MANDDLIARLEAAEGPQFVLDVEIWKTCHPADWKWQHGRFNPPAYTASIDAALTLVPEGWHLAALGFIHPDFRQETELDWRADIFGPVTWAEDDGFPEPQYEAVGGNAPTPALAICIAALKARSHD